MRTYKYVVGMLGASTAVSLITALLWFGHTPYEFQSAFAGARPATSLEPAAQPGEAAVRDRWVLTNGRLYLYTRADPGDELREVVVGDRKVARFDATRLPGRNEEEVVLIDLGEVGNAGTGKTLVRWSSGQVAHWSGRGVPDWCVRESQFCFPLRVVECQTADGRCQLTLYNESNSAKPALEVLSVAVDDVDVTSQAQLPGQPMLATDRELQNRDYRFVSFPLTAAQQQYKVQLGYRLLPPPFASPVPHDGSTRYLTIGVRPGLRFPIGGDGSPLLPGCVCVYQGALELPVRPEVVNRRLAEVRQQAPDVPVYAWLLPGESTLEWRRLAEKLDFVVVGPNLRRTYETVELTAEPRELIGESSNWEVPVFVDLHLGLAPPTPSMADFHWWARQALACGSRGLMWTTPTWLNQDECRKWVDKHGEMLRRGCSVPLRCRANRPGISVMTWACGTKELVIFVTNEHCSLTAGQAPKPWDAMIRKGVQVTLECDNRWASSLTASDCGSGEVLPASFASPGSLVIEVPDLQSTCMIRVQADSGSAPTSLTSNSRESNVIETIGPPFVWLGGRSLGGSVPFSFGVRNLSPAACRISLDARAMGPATVPVVHLPPVTVPAGETATIGGFWHLPRSSGTAIQPLELVTHGATTERFRVSLEASLESTLVAEPRGLDFGEIAVGSSPLEQTIRLHGSAELDVQSLNSLEPPDARLSISAGSDRTLSISLVPSRTGPVQSVLRLRPMGNPRQTVAVQINGRIVEPVRAQPGRLAVSGETPSLRSIMLRSARPFQVSASDLPAGVTVATLPTRNAATHQIELRVDPMALLAPAQTARKFSVPLRCVFENGSSQDLVLPGECVRGTRGAPTQVAAASDVPDRVTPLRERIGRLVHEARLAQLGPEWPNWVRAHNLLLFLPTATRTPEEAERLALRLRELLRQPTDGSNKGIIGGFYRGVPEIIRRGDKFDLEHHPGQFLTYLGMADVPPETPLAAPGQTATVHDLFKSWSRSLRPEGELSYVVNGLVSYLPPGTEWQDKFGRSQQLGSYVERLIAHPEPTCDGSHWLMALARLTAQRRWLQDKSVASRWSAAEETLSVRMRVFQAGQRPDGRLPLDPEFMKANPHLAQDDLDRPSLIWITGHQLEWLSVALPDQDLTAPWVLRVVELLTTAIEQQYPKHLYFDTLRTMDDCKQAGDLCHALSGLSRWRHRVASGKAATTR